MFFNTWEAAIRPAVVGTLAYLALIVLLRTSGKRTLSKLNAFDFIVTVALGSTLATILLSKDIALIEGIVGFTTLIVLQLVITWLSVRSRTVRRLVKSEPTILFFHGDYLVDTMKEQRVTEAEVRQAVRAAGYADMDEVGAVVLETDGGLNVLKDVSPNPTSLSGIAPVHPTKGSPS
jgi:uncharacterized membrane protein YcaP (DUF421 family)